MAKFADDSMIDGALDVLATATRMTVATAQPANFAGIAAVSLADETLTGADFTKANGDVSGRKVTVAQQADLTINSTGDADHILFDDGVTLLYGTTATLQTLTSGGTVTVPEIDVEIEDPA